MSRGGGYPREWICNGGGYPGGGYPRGGWYVWRGVSTHTPGHETWDTREGTWDQGHKIPGRDIGPRIPTSM